MYGWWTGLTIVAGGSIPLLFSAGVLQCIWACIRPMALILGRDRIQLLRGGRVVGQIPFSNIAEVRESYIDGFTGVAINVIDPGNKDTFWPFMHNWYWWNRRNYRVGY